MLRFLEKRPEEPAAETYGMHAERVGKRRLSHLDN